MVFKFVILCAVAAAVAHGAAITHLTTGGSLTTYSAAGPALGYATYASPEVATTHENTVRSFDGTVTHHSKAVDTAFSSVRKSDTRVSNNVYASAPAVTATHYAAPAAAVAYHAAPAAAVAYHAAPAAAAVAYHAAPALTTTHYAAAAPAAAVAYHAAAAPAHEVHYSAAPLVAHVSFDGIGAHYAF